MKRRTNRKCQGAAAFWAVILLTLSAHAQIQLGGLKWQDTYDKRAPDDTNRVKTLITSAQAEVVGAGLHRGKGMQIENYTEDGKTNIIARATDCLLNYKDRTVTSTNRLELQTGNGLVIEGYGYLCQLTNFTLYLSNRVRTRIYRSLTESDRSLFPSLGNAHPATVSPSSGTNVSLVIRSEHFYLNNASNLVIYTGNVQVENAQAVLSCAQLTIQRATNGAIQFVLAEREVVIVNKSDLSRASGDRALYAIRGGRETLDLTGHALWLDGQRSIRAEAFSFDLAANHVQARRKALLKLPRTMVNQAELFPGLASASKTNRALQNFTNQFVEIHSDWMDFQMPGTNQPPRSLVARTNVLILSPIDNVRATAAEASYNEGSGLLELRRKAVWQADERIVKGDHLLFDRTNRIFRALGNAYLKVPVSSLGEQTLLAEAKKHTNSPSRFLETTSGSIEYEGDWLTFQDRVKGQLLENGRPLGQLESRFLALQFSNRVQRIAAKQKIFVQQFPVSKEDGRRVGKTLRCESLNVMFATNGTLDQIVAHDHVRGVQETFRTNSLHPLLTVLDADRVTATFLNHTNQLKDLVAEKNVSIKHENRSASGEMAIYTATNNVILLTGHPTASAPEATITEAEVIMWDRTRNKFYSRQPKAVGNPNTFKTNQTDLPLPGPALQPEARK